MTDLSQAHDKFIRELFSRPEVGRNYIENYVPPEIVACLDLSTLEMCKDSFIDPELREHFSDYLCRLRLKNGNEAYVYFLMEHKSRPERMISFQLLRYMTRIWEQAYKAYGKSRKTAEKGKKKSESFLIPPIIPMVFYHGKQQWKIPLNFRFLFDIPAELEQFIPDFQYLLCDISNIDDDEIKGEVMLRVGILIMKYIFKEELLEKLPGILGLLRELLHKRTGLEYLETILTYLAKGTEKLNKEDLSKAVKAVFSEQGGNAMATIAEQWIEEGRGEGREEGKIEGLLRGIDVGLKLKFGTQGMVLLHEIKKIGDTEILMSIQNGLLTANSPDELKKIYQ